MSIKLLSKCMNHAFRYQAYYTLYLALTWFCRWPSSKFKFPTEYESGWWQYGRTKVSWTSDELFPSLASTLLVNIFWIFWLVFDLPESCAFCRMELLLFKSKSELSFCKASSWKRMLLHGTVASDARLLTALSDSALYLLGFQSNPLTLT